MRTERNQSQPRPHRRMRALAALALALVFGFGGAPAGAQGETEDDLVQLDFDDVELSVVIDTIARLTERNFIYDDRVRGRITVVSPTPIPVDQAYVVFESVLQVKGFTTVETPGGAIKIVPLREAKESTVETVESADRPPNRDRFMTRLIPLRYIDAESIVNTLKPLVSKDSAMAAYAPTNTVILTESASNIRRMMAILESIDVETYKEELAVIKVEYADASTLSDQLAEIFGGESAAPARRARGRRAARRRQAASNESVQDPFENVRILTDERTNSLLVLAARAQLDEVRGLVRKLDVPVTGGGRIHVYYLKHANAEEIGQTLSSLVSSSGQATPGGGPEGGGQAQALRAAITSLAGGILITPDPATNSLVIQASQEGFQTISQVIEKLDVLRPQVLVEALILEVDITDERDLGFNGIVRIFEGDTSTDVVSGTGGTPLESAGEDLAAGAGAIAGGPVGIGTFLARFILDNRNDSGEGELFEAIVTASARDSNTNVLSAPHILTSDNEQAEIRVGQNIPIITSRVESAAGQEVGLSSSVNVERQDVGVTLRVTPQITEGETLRLQIFQEITGITDPVAGNVEEVGVTLTNRRVENTVVVADGETIVIGGLIGEDYQDGVTKVPFLGDIPFLGWLFKSTTKSLRKTNLLVFLTPHIVRSTEDFESETIRKREEFREHSGEALHLSQAEEEEEDRRREEAERTGEPYERLDPRNPVLASVLDHANRYPPERIDEIERLEQERRERLRAEQAAARQAPRYFVEATVFGDEEEAIRKLTELIDLGYDGTLLSEEVGRGIVIHEIRLGPYDSLEEAQGVGGLMKRSHDLAPAVTVEAPEEQP